MSARTLESLGELPQIAWEFITPAKAKEYLDSSMGNRNIRPTHLAKLVRDLRNGTFLITNQTVGFDKSGHLIDGHHRCLAIKESGIGAWFIVVREVDRIALEYIDAGIPRSVRDSIQLLDRYEGKDVPNNSAISIAAIIEIMPNAHYFKYTRHELISILERAAHAISPFTSRGGSGVTRGVKTAAARALLTGAHDADRIKDFYHTLFTGVMNSRGDSAAVHFRNYLLKSKDRHGSNIEVERYRKAQNALLAFLEKRKLTKVYESKIDVFPLPDTWEKIASQHEENER